MSNEIKIIRKNEHKTSRWSGGTTTQLYIYPEESEYDKRNFLFRISSAKVEVDESVFTHLPDINREIMIIDGELVLKHEGHHTTRLSRFDKDCFSGDWSTRSYGKVTDFNLMMNKGCYGTIEHIKVEIGSNNDIKFDKHEIYDKSLIILYCVNGQVSIAVEEKVDLYEGDLFVFTSDKNSNAEKISIYNKLNEESHLIINRLYFN